MKKIFPVFALFSVFIAAVSLRGHLPATAPLKPEQEEGADNPMDGIREFGEYEFNLLKDPRTGKIPEGIHDAEWAVAMNMPVRSGKTTTGYTWAFRGPNNLGGRTRTIAFDIRNANIILSGGVSGGIMRSSDAGITWTRVSPVTQIHNVTSIAQDTRVGFQDIWYASTGEALGNSTSEDGAFYLGHGVFKSTDNGVTWARLANSNTTTLEGFNSRDDLISKVIVNPTNGHVYFAALGQIQRSVDAGVTWNVVLGPPAGGFSTSHVTDIVCTSGGRLYAAFAGVVATTHDGVWTSTTGNSASWTRIAGTGAGVAGWDPQGSYGRVVLALAPSNQNILFALYDNFNVTSCPTAAIEADLFRWDQGTTTWTDLSATLPDEAGCLDGNDPFAVQGGYDLVIAVKPDNQNTLFIGGTNVYRSVDAGATWTRIGGYNSSASYAVTANHHPDIHALAFAPGDNNTLWTGDDGGIQRADISGAVAWTSRNSTYNTYQYYHVAIHPGTGVNDVIGGAQDNGTTTGIGGATNFVAVGSGDGVAVGLGSGAAPYFQYMGSQLGNIRRRASDGSSNVSITPSTAGYASQFVTYFYLNPDNTNDMYVACQISGNNRILRTTNAPAVTSATWTTMTFNYTGYVRAMAATRGAYAASHRLYLGTDAGSLYRLTDPRNCAVGTVPVDITPTGMAGLGTIVGIAVHPTNHDEILVVYSNYGVNSIWHTTNAGVASPTWTNVEGNLSLPSIRSCAIVENSGATEYVVGTSIGVYATATLSGGATVWAQEGAAVMNFAVATSMAYRPVDRVLLVGTHGNGMFMTTLAGPVGLDISDFSGIRVGSDVQLEWKAPWSNRVATFQVESSADGSNFTPIGSIAPAGTSGQISSYTYTDLAPTPGTWYYRIAQVETGGNTLFSNTVELSVSPYSNLMVSGVFPNPVRDNLSVSIEMPAAGEVSFLLYDLQGRTIESRTLNLGEGARTVTFDASALPAGSYYLNIRTMGQTILRQVVKQ